MATEHEVNAAKCNAWNALAKLLDELTALAAAARKDLEAGRGAGDDAPRRGRS